MVSWFMYISMGCFRHIYNLQYLASENMLKSLQYSVADPGFTGAAFFSSAVPPGSGAFQMPTRPSSSSSSSAASASTLRGGGRANLRNASVTFSLFLHEASLG